MLTDGFGERRSIPWFQAPHPALALKFAVHDWSRLTFNVFRKLRADGCRVMVTALPLLASLSCGGGSTQPSSLPPPGLAISPQGTAIVGVTALTFQATNPVPQTTYAWNFGDGTTASGATATHVYAREGTFSAVLSAGSGGATGSATAVVSVRSVTGTWRPDFLFAPCFTVRLTQTGATVDAVAINGTAASASVQSPRTVTLTIAPTPAQNCGDAVQSRSGTFDDTLASFTLTFTPTQTDTWRRQ